MKQQNRWLLLVLTGCLLGGSFLGPFGRLHAAPAPESAPETAKVSINKASTSELESIQGIGPMLAQRIVEYRETKGRFERLEDLTQVRGIGGAKFERIKSQITL